MAHLSSFLPVWLWPTPDWQWLSLREALVREQSDELQLRVRMADVAALWGCSPKTARRTLQRWQAQGRCRYEAGQGRGQWSRLTFAELAEPQVHALAAALAGAGRLDEWSRLNTLGFPASWTRPPQVQRLFGLHHGEEGQDRLRLLVTGPLTSLNPLNSWVTLESWLLHQVFDGLTAQSPESGPPRPALAHHWAADAAGLTWHFYLRKGVRFHHGERLTAEHVVRTLERVQAHAAWSLPSLREALALDDYTVQLRLAAPDPLLPRRMAQTPLLIQPHEPVSAPPAGGLPELSGTGAFRCQAFTGGLRLQAFDDHWAGRPLLDEAEFYFAPPSARGGRMELRGADPAAAQPHLAVEKGVQFLIWNSRRPAAHELALRRAVAELHDIRAFWSEMGWPAQPLASSFYPEFSAQRPVPVRSLQRARAWLETVPRPLPPLNLYALPFPDAWAEAQWLAARAQSLGLEIQVRRLRLEDDCELESQADLVLMGEVGGADTGLSFWTALHSPKLLFRRLLPPGLLREVEHILGGVGQPEANEPALIAAAERALQVSGWVNLTHHRVKEVSLSAGLSGVAPDLYGRVGLRGLWVNRWPVK